MRKSTPKELAKKLGLSVADGLESVLKAELISAILKTIDKKGFTHSEISKRSGVPRSAVTGILNGSLQKVSLDRVLRLLEAVHLTAELRIKEAA
jgi:predicted XRE-type DNA-binding protein